MQKLTDKQIQQLINQYIRNKLEYLETERIMSKELTKFDEIDEPIQDVDKLLDDLIADNISDLRCFRYERAGAKVKKILEQQNLEIDHRCFEFRKLCREYLKAEVKMFEIEQSRVKGDYTIDDEKRAFPIPEDKQG